MKRFFSVLLVFVLIMPELCRAQVGRMYVTVETWIGFSRIAYVGKIVELKEVDYESDEPLTRAQGIGEPYKMIFEVNETLKGKKVDRLEVVLSLQGHEHLEFMRDRETEIMLVAGPERFSSSPSKCAKVGIEENGERVDGDYYHFRVLEPIKADEKNDRESFYASGLNSCCDSSRMFTMELGIVSGRDEILGRARAFAKRYPDTVLATLSVMVPNEFGALVGTPNAFSMIVFPVCPGTKETLKKMKKDPGEILRRIPPRIIHFDTEMNRTRLEEGAEKALQELELDGGKG